MLIRDYTCKCGQKDFFFAQKGNQLGIYCSTCGKWLKWADKDEQNLAKIVAEMEEKKKRDNQALFWECRNCGAQMRGAFLDEKHSVIFCPHCGKKLDAKI